MRSYGVIKEKGIRVSKPSQVSVFLLRRAGAIRARSHRAKGSGAPAVRLVGLLTMGLLALLVVPAFASGVPAHPFKEVFGSVAQPGLEEPARIAVDPVSGDVYVVDYADQTLHRYKPNGEPDPFEKLGGSNVIDGVSGADEVPGVKEILSSEPGTVSEVQVSVAPAGATGGTAGDIYVTNSEHGQIDVFAPSGEYVGSSSSPYPCGVSVGPEGDVYVGDYYEGVYKLIPTKPGAFTEAEHSPFVAPEACNVAAGYGSSAGSVFYSVFGSSSVIKLDGSTGNKDYEVFAGPSKGGISVDPVTGHLYVGTEPEPNAIKEFDVSGASSAIEVSRTSLASGPGGVAANGASGGFYVARAHSEKLEVFGPTPPLHTVTVTVSGEGEVSETAGSPTPASGAISGCEEAAGSCSAEYLQGEEPELQATAGSGSEFVKWTVEHAASTTCTGGTTPCKVKVGTENITASAAFALSGFPLAIEKEGAGVVTVASVQNGLGLKQIACGSVCSELFAPASVVELSATPGTGSQFTGWSTATGNPGTCTGTTSPCQVTVNEAVTLKAKSALLPEGLTVSATGPGSVECEFAHSTAFGACATPQSYGTNVKVRATPDLGAELSSLSGTGSASGCSPGGCEFTITQTSGVTVEFAAIAHPSVLTIFKGGNGKGTITSLAPHTGITCGPACEEAQAGFEEGQTVELEETPQSGSVFAGWIGCHHLTATTKCQVKLGSPEVEATAVFLVEGKEGINGKEGATGKEGAPGREGVNGKEGATGKEGVTGKEGAEGKRGQIGLPGETGEQGPAGPSGGQGSQGSPGAQGAVGPVGPAGPAGAQGKEGPPGPATKVTCKITQAKGQKAKVTCTVKYAAQAKASSVRRTTRWQLVHHGRVIAHGANHRALRIHLGALPHGRYVLYLVGDHTGTVIDVR